MIGGIWWFLANPLASMVSAVAMLSILVWLGYHRDPTGKLARRRMAAVVILSASAYTFALCAFCELFMHSPHLSVLIKYGFGEQRVAWLLLGVIIDICFSIWDEFRIIPAVDAAQSG
jgi:hypothetical protein